MIVILLGLVFLLILVLPLWVQAVEHRVELFLLGMGVTTVTLSHLFGHEPLLNVQLLESALVEPVRITLATLVFGLAFRAFRDRIRSGIVSWERMLGPRLFAFVLVLALGLLSSIITAIIAALLLCEVISALGMDREYEVRLVILSCFSIGMGAALTPIGEPLSTIALAKLRGGTVATDSLFLVRMLGIYILPGLLIMASLGAFLRGKEVGRAESLSEDSRETIMDIVRRTGLVYLFVSSLVLLGTGFKPLIDSHISRLPAPVLYWVNISSAVLDNATLAAAELGPQMNVEQITGILMGIIISGGMLIPGNIPNIISASKLRISSREWALFGGPLGFLLMAAYFVVLQLS